MQFTLKLIVVMVPVVAFLFYFSRTKSSPFSILASIYLILIFSVTVFGVAKYTYSNYDEPPEWDFVAFWLDGKVVLTGGNFYDAKSYQEMPLPYALTDGFREEIIDVGFRYPPFTMLLFLPLSLFSVSKAYILWQILNFLLCIACMYEIWKLFLKDYGILSLLLVATLMLRLESTRATFYVAQTNFLALLFFLMFWKNRSKNWGGIWLALCVVVKPYMALLWIYPLLTSRWRVFVIATLTLLVFTLLSVVVFGSDVVISFFRNPTPEMPAYVFAEEVNQSLLATILRLSPDQIIKESPLLHPLYLGISLLFTSITAFVTIRNKSNEDGWVVLSILFLALIVYPATLTHYSVFLIMPVSLLLQYSNYPVKEKLVVFSVILVTYSLSGYDSGNYMFYVNLFMWLICIVLAVKSNTSQLPYECSAASV